MLTIQSLLLGGVDGLQDEERKCGITPAPSKPVVERMAAVGMPREVIDQLADMLDTLFAPGIGEIPGLN
jgi:hypothetical protein